MSVVAARGIDGSFAHWGVIDNAHRNHILDLSVAPADVPPDVATRGGRNRPRHPRTARRRRRPLRRVLPHQVRQAAGQRARPPPAQLRPPDDRRQRHQPVRAATPRRLRPAARRHPPAPPRRDGATPRRSVGTRRTGLGRRVRDAGRQASPVRQGRSAPGPEDGPSHRVGGDASTALLAAARCGPR